MIEMASLFSDRTSVNITQASPHRVTVRERVQPAFILLQSHDQLIIGERFLCMSLAHVLTEAIEAEG